MLHLLNSLILSEEVSWSDKILQVIRRDTVLKLETLNFGLNDHIVCHDPSHSSRSKQTVKMNEYTVPHITKRFDIII